MKKSQSTPIKLPRDYVQAILGGRKSMHRLVIKPQPIIDEDSGYVFSGNRKKLYKNDIHHPPWQEGFMDDFFPFLPGDILWVKEKWGEVTAINSTTFKKLPTKFRYEADLKHVIEGHDKFFPASNMPIDAARIFLKVKDICIKRLQDVTEEDAVREGVEMTCNGPKFKQWRIYTSSFGFQANTALWSYQSLWEKINGRESWDNNPWVWVFTFDVLTTTGGKAK